MRIQKHSLYVVGWTELVDQYTSLETGLYVLSLWPSQTPWLLQVSLPLMTQIPGPEKKILSPTHPPGEFLWLLQASSPVQTHSQPGSNYYICPCETSAKIVPPPSIVYFLVHLGGSGVKNPPARAGDLGSSPGLERSPGERNGNPLQYSCLGNPWTEGA